MTSNMQKIVLSISAAAVLLAMAVGLSNCASCSRELKTLSSDFNGGMERRVTLYDYNGQVISEWEGLIDLESSDQEIFFDLNGKRTIIQGGIVVCQEL